MRLVGRVLPGIKRGVLTRNCDRAMRHVLDRIGHAFDVTLSRSFEPVKPHPAALLHIASSWATADATHHLVMVGDSVDDMQCGRAAGFITVLIGRAGDRYFDEARHLADHTIEDLRQVLEIVT